MGVRRRPTYYEIAALRDGAVLSAYPNRKPGSGKKTRTRFRCDADGVFVERQTSGTYLRDVNYEGRTRFQDIVSNRLNTRRAIRELVQPRLDAMSQELLELRSQLTRIEDLLRAAVNIRTATNATG